MIDPRKTPLRYGFIGLGTMGWGMAYNLRSFVPSSARLTICETSEEMRRHWVLQAPGPVYVGKTPKAVAENSASDIRNRKDVVLTSVEGYCLHDAS